MVRTIVELSCVYGLAALGVLLTAVVVEFYDLTVDASFSLGAALSATLLLGGAPPTVALIAAVVGGLLAGGLTALVWRSGVEPLLAGILVMFALYSVNLRILRASNVSLGSAPSLFGTSETLVLLLLVGIGALCTLYLLTSRLGATMRAFPRSKQFIEAVGMPSAAPVIASLMLSNGLVAGAGALMAQVQRYADVTMGEGTLIYSLAAIILGRATLAGRRRPLMLARLSQLGSGKGAKSFRFSGGYR